MKQCEVMVEVNWQVQHMVKYLLQWKYVSCVLGCTFVCYFTLPESMVSKYFSYIICSMQFSIACCIVCLY